MGASNRERVSVPTHFAHDREVYVINSVGSGNRKAEETFQNVVAPYIEQNIPHLQRKKNFFVYNTTSPATISQLTTKTFLRGAKKGLKITIILLSGDGGLIDIVNTFTATLQREIDDSRPPSIFFKPSVVLIPEGTANALAHSAQIVSRDPIKVMMTGRARPLPQFEVTFNRAARLVTEEGQKREEFVQPSDEPIESGQLGYYDPEDHVRCYGCVVFSWGLHASLVAMSDTTEMRKHGIERFKMAAGDLMKENHVYSGTVKFRKDRYEPWQTFKHKNGEEKKHKYILATMVSNLEEKFCISPASKPMDGSLRLVAIGDETPETLMRITAGAYNNGSHVESEKDVVTYEEIDSLRIEFDEEDEKWRQVCIDGKIVAVEKGGWVEMRKLPAVGVDGRRVVDLVC